MSPSERAQRAIDRYQIERGRYPTYLVVSRPAWNELHSALYSSRVDTGGADEFYFNGVRVLPTNWLAGVCYTAGELLGDSYALEP